MNTFLILLLTVVFVNGCGNNMIDYRDVPFIDINHDEIIINEHMELCRTNTESIFCKKSLPVGYIRPTKSYSMQILLEMNSNFKYENNNKWIYNNTVYEELIGDCEDIASTMARHMIDDGVDNKYLHLAYRKISESESHIFLVVDTSDAGLLHLDYANSGYPIEPKINFHMRLDNAGVYKWVKGNIK